nr:hypothetical protein Iba_scaffold32363CG0010 [Ipomoea batatas]
MREETRHCRRANNRRRVPPLEVARCLLDCHATPSSPPIVASPSQEKGDAGRRCQAPPPLPYRAGNRGGRRQLLSPVVNSTRLAGVPLPPVVFDGADCCRDDDHGGKGAGLTEAKRMARLGSKSGSF